MPELKTSNNPWLDESFNKNTALLEDLGFNIQDLVERLGIETGDNPMSNFMSQNFLKLTDTPDDYGQQGQFAQTDGMGQVSWGWPFWAKAGNKLHYRDGPVSIGHSAPGNQCWLHVYHPQRTILIRLGANERPWLHFHSVNTGDGFAFGTQQNDASVKQFRINYDNPIGTASQNFITFDAINNRIGFFNTAPTDDVELTGSFKMSGSFTCDDLYLQDTNASNTLLVHYSDNDISNRILNISVRSGDRTLTFYENFTIGDGADGMLTFSNSSILTCEANSQVNQDLTTDASAVQFHTLNLIGVGAFCQVDSSTTARFIADAHNADAFIDYQEANVTKWTAGIDYSDSIAYVISEGSPGTNNRLKIASGGAVTIGSTLRWSEFVHDVTTDYNLFLGKNAGASISDGGQYNIFIGESAGNAVTTADQSVFIGYQAGYTETTHNDCTFIGYQAGYNNAEKDNVWIGTQAGYGDAGGSSGKFNVGIGARVGQDLTTGHKNTLIGYQAGLNLTTGYGNFLMGCNAGLYLTTGYYNTFIGGEIATSITATAPHQNVFIGAEAGLALTSGNRNASIGVGSGRTLTSGYYNTFIGNNAGRTLAGGNSNTFIGRGAGFSATGNLGVFIGYSAGYSETGSNKLYIENSNSAVPLIYGEFDNNLVRIHGKLWVEEAAGGDQLSLEESGTNSIINTDTNPLLIKTTGTTALTLATNQTATFADTVTAPTYYITDTSKEAPSKTTASWSKSIGSGGDYADWATMIDAMPDMIAHAVTVTIKTGTTLTEECDIKNKHGLTSAGAITVQAEKYFPTTGDIPTADSASATTLRDATLATAALGDDYFNGCWVFIVDGTGTDNGFIPITDYTDVTGDIHVSSWTGTEPDNTSRYLIVGALIEGGGTRNYCFELGTNTVRTLLYGIGMKSSNIDDLYAEQLSSLFIYYCGFHDADRDGLRMFSVLYGAVRKCGFVANNTDNASQRGGVRFANCVYSEVQDSGFSDNNRMGVMCEKSSWVYLGDNFGDANGVWGAYAVNSAQIQIFGTECSGSSGNHSDAGGAGTAASDQAAAY